MAIAFEGRPVATDDAVFGDDGLKDAAVVVSTVAAIGFMLRLSIISKSVSARVLPTDRAGDC